MHAHSNGLKFEHQRGHVCTRDSNLPTDENIHTVMESNLSRNACSNTDVDMHTVMESNLSINVDMYALGTQICVLMRTHSNGL